MIYNSSISPNNDILIYFVKWQISLYQTYWITCQDCMIEIIIGYIQLTMLGNIELSKNSISQAPNLIFIHFGRLNGLWKIINHLRGIINSAIVYLIKTIQPFLFNLSQSCGTYSY